MMSPILALFSWPVVSAFLFQRLSVQTAILVTVVGGYLLLPEATSLDLPLLPALNKSSIPALSALLLVAVFASKETLAKSLPGLFSRNSVAGFLVALLVFGAFMTVVTNRDPLVFVTRYLPGMRIYDAFSAVLGVIMLMLPLILGRKFFARPSDHQLILTCLCIAGLIYSLLALYEIRMSPQLNRIFYGFFPHEWKQHVRGGGFRPLVFLNHGLLLGIFFSATILAAFGLARVRPDKRAFYLLAGFWLLGVLILSKSLGALLITLVLLPVIWWLPVRLQLMVATVIAVLFMSYPMLRSAHLVPVDALLERVAASSPQRAQSLETRLINEEALLAKTNERPVFGWGGWGRSRIFDDQGRDITTADGYWIIQLSVTGWTGYLAKAGLIAIPIGLLFWRQRTYGIGRETAILALILAGNMVDLIPNSSVTLITWLIAGALWGRLEVGAKAVAPDDDPSVQKSVKGVRQRKMPVAGTAGAGVSPYTRQTERIYHRRNHNS